MFKIGQGLDIHRFISGEGIKLGGVFITTNKKIKAHSDGDILFHSISNAFLSAIGLPDIGEFFSDQEEKNKNISSEKILEYVYEKVKKEGYLLNNLANIIICEHPRLALYRLAIIENISQLLNTSKKNISVHFGTAEKLGAIGMDQGIVSSSFVSISRG